MDESKQHKMFPDLIIYEIFRYFRNHEDILKFSHICSDFRRFVSLSEQPKRLINFWFHFGNLIDLKGIVVDRKTLWDNVPIFPNINACCSEKTEFGLLMTTTNKFYCLMKFEKIPCPLNTVIHFFPDKSLFIIVIKDPSKTPSGELIFFKYDVALSKFYHFSTYHYYSNLHPIHLNYDIRGPSRDEINFGASGHKWNFANDKITHFHHNVHWIDFVQTFALYKTTYMLPSMIKHEQHCLYVERKEIYHWGFGFSEMKNSNDNVSIVILSDEKFKYQLYIFDFNQKKVIRLDGKKINNQLVLINHIVYQESLIFFLFRMPGMFLLRCFDLCTQELTKVPITFEFDSTTRFLLDGDSVWLMATEKSLRITVNDKRQLDTDFVCEGIESSYK